MQMTYPVNKNPAKKHSAKSNRMNLRQKLSCLLAGTLLPFIAVSANADSVTLAQLWSTKELRTPESVLVHKAGTEKYLLVTEIEGDGAALDGKGGIAKLSMSGEILDQDWVRGLNAPKGMAVHKQKLYVADVNDLVVIDMASQKIEAKINVPDSVFLNDVAVDEKGVVYVSDTRTNKIHRFVDHKPEVFLENIASANGLYTSGKNLIIGAGSTLLSVGPDKKQTELASGFESGIDGIEMTKPGEFLVSCWVGLMYYVHADGRIEKLIDSREDKINTADIGYDRDKNLVFVPNFLKDSVTAYQLK